MVVYCIFYITKVPFIVGILNFSYNQTFLVSGFASRPGQTKDHLTKWYELPPCMARNALGLEFDRVVRLSKGWRMSPLRRDKTNGN